MKKIFTTLTTICLILLTYFVLIPSLILQYGKSKIYTDITNIPTYNIAIVFGAGLKLDGTPNDMLEDRLDTATDLYNQGKIEKLLLSGDNSLEEYNEPQAMYEYLTLNKGIPTQDVVRDFAGLRTYDTCARAKNIWDIDKAILISQGYHLSRAIFTCNTLGVESTGFSATKEIYAGETYYKLRELLAIHKAVIDVYIIHPEYIGGEIETDFLH
ncbi:YdcF family protein [bacterium]|nr:YdcF family protein [bacterium]